MIVIFLTVLSVLDGMYVDYDTLLLSRIITAECSICNTDEQYLVGSTVLNRRDHSRFPNTIEAVINQEGQYIGRTSRWFIITEKSFEVAKNLLDGKGRDYDVFYFYARDSPDQDFVKKMKKHVIYSKKYHIFAKQEK